MVAYVGVKAVNSNVTVTNGNAEFTSADGPIVSIEQVRMIESVLARKYGFDNVALMNFILLREKECEEVTNVASD
jgi:hypothetical protein